MTLLATIDTVKVTDEGETLKLTATDFGDGYTENLYVDAETGVPQKFVGGEPGQGRPACRHRLRDQARDRR